MHGRGGARGPYYGWTSAQVGGDAANVNAAVKNGLFPPMPSNWESMTGPQQQQYLWSVHKLFPDLSCPVAGQCSFVKVTGTGARSIPGVVNYIIMAPYNVTTWAVNHPGQAAEAAAAVTCTLSVGPESGEIICDGATAAAFGGDTAVNLANATSIQDFWAHEGVTTAEFVVLGGGGLVKSALGTSEAFTFKTASGETVSVLPQSVGGRIALNAVVNAPGAAGTAMSPKIDSAVFGPAHPPPEHHVRHHG